MTTFIEDRINFTCLADYAKICGSLVNLHLWLIIELLNVLVRISYGLAWLDLYLLFLFKYHDNLFVLVLFVGADLKCWVLCSSCFNILWSHLLNASLIHSSDSSFLQLNRLIIPRANLKKKWEKSTHKHAVHYCWNYHCY